MSCLVSKNKALVKTIKMDYITVKLCFNVSLVCFVSCRVQTLVWEGLYWGDDSLWETGFHNCPLLLLSSSLWSTAGSFHAKCQMEDF